MIKVNLILGFLGAGKTTFIRSLLQRGMLDQERIVLVVNDYGPENYDATTLRETAVDIIEITNGCLCCGNQHEFQKILTELAQREDLDRIIIEPSGLFLPEQIVSLFSQKPLQTILKLEPVFVVVDMEFLARSTRIWPPFISRHIEFADYVITNKEDSVSKEKSESVKHHLEQINKNALQCSFSAAIEHFTNPKRQFIQKENIASIKSRHDISFKSITEDISFKDTEELKSFFDKQGHKLLRAKGIVLIDDKKIFVNYTQNCLETNPAAPSQSLGLSCFYA